MKFSSFSSRANVHSNAEIPISLLLQGTMQVMSFIFCSLRMYFALLILSGVIRMHFIRIKCTHCLLMR